MEQTLLFFARHASPFMTKYLKEVVNELIEKHGGIVE